MLRANSPTTRSWAARLDWTTNRLHAVSASSKTCSCLHEYPRSPENARESRNRFGSVLDSFVYGELLKHASSAEGDYELFYYCHHDKMEVDFVIGNAAGDVMGVEVKSTATVNAEDLRGVHRLSEAVGPRFRKGIVLYDGTETLPLSEHICAVPLSTLWGD